MRWLIVLIIFVSISRSGSAQSNCNGPLYGNVLSVKTVNFWSTLSKDEQISVLNRFRAFAKNKRTSDLQQTQAALRHLIGFTLTGAVQAKDTARWSALAFVELADSPETVPEVRDGLFELANVFSSEY
jgi:hypothetical protein